MVLVLYRSSYISTYRVMWKYISRFAVIISVCVYFELQSVRIFRFFHCFSTPKVEKVEFPLEIPLVFGYNNSHSRFYAAMAEFAILKFYKSKYSLQASKTFSFISESVIIPTLFISLLCDIVRIC